jgi:hypothetical protein
MAQPRLPSVLLSLWLQSGRSCSASSRRANGRKRSSPGILGICSLRRELAGVAPDRDARSPPESRGVMASGNYRNCAGDAGDAGPRCRDLSLLPSFFTILSSRQDETSACPVLGRFARSIGTGSGPGTSPRVPQREGIISISFNDLPTFLTSRNWKSRFPLTVS